MFIWISRRELNRHISKVWLLIFFAFTVNHSKKNHCRKITVPSQCHLSTWGFPYFNAVGSPWATQMKHSVSQCQMCWSLVSYFKVTSEWWRKNSPLRIWHCLKAPTGIGLRGNQTSVLQFHLLAMLFSTLKTVKWILMARERFALSCQVGNFEPHTILQGLNLWPPS